MPAKVFLVGVSLVLTLVTTPAAASSHRVKRGSIVLKCDQPGARVLVDGHDYGPTPLVRPIMVRAGSHTVELTKDGYVDAKQKVAVATNGIATVEMTLRSETIDVVLEPIDAQGPELVPLPPPPASLSLPPTNPPHRQPTLLPTLFVRPPNASQQATEVESPLATEARLETPAPWYTSWWLWTGAAAVIAGSVALGVELHNRSGATHNQVWTLGQSTVSPSHF